MAVPDLTPLANINETDIKEFVQGENSPRVDRFSIDRADLDMTYKVPGTKLVGFLMWMLGVDYVDANGKLRRSTPAFHPVHCWAFATSVQVNGQFFRGDDVKAVKWDFQNTPGKWAQYSCVVTYDMPIYNVIEDGDADFENERYTSKEFTSAVEMVSVENGPLLYDANAGNAWNNNPVVQQLIARRETSGIELVWHRVPQLFVQADDDSFPTKLLQIQGRVNDATFMGQEAETLLCKDVKYKKYVSPLATNSVGSMYWMYDITFSFVRYDPLPKGKSGETRHGWNFFIAPDFKYYYATTTGGRKVFQTFTFAQAFTIYTDTWTAP